MSNSRIRRGDTVEVKSGREKGQRGEVLRVIPKASRLLVQGIAMRKKHQRQIQTAGRTMSPGIIHFEAPIHISNVQLVCPNCDETTRVGILREDGVRKRICKKCGESVED
ncbi:MAG: 50S ribosomal protein L24 [Anaerolineales bacterium]